MSTIQQQLHEFQAFVNQRSQSATDSVSLDALLLEWYDSKHSIQIQEIIQQGLADINQGKGRPANDVTTDLRNRLSGQK